MKLYLIIGDGGLNGPWPVSAHREPQDIKAAYRKWYDELTAQNMMHPYENGFVQYEINSDTLEVKEIDKS